MEFEMKKVVPIVVIAVFLGIVGFIFLSISGEERPVTIVSGNTKMEPLPIKLNHTNDPQCAMLIKTQRNAAQVAVPDGRTWFFDDPGCMILWLEKKSFRNHANMWVYTIDTKRWIDAKKAYYGIADETEMKYGFGAREQANSTTISFEEMRLRMLRGENLTDPKIRKKLLGI